MADRRLAGAVMVLGPVADLAQPLFAVWLKALTDAVADGDVPGGTSAGVALGATMVLVWLLAAAGTRLRTTLEERTGFACEQEVMAAAATLPTLEHCERPEYHDRLELLRESQGALGRALGAVVSNLSGVLALAVTVILLGWVHPALVVLPLFAVPSLWAAMVARRKLAAAEEGTAEQQRLAEHLLDLATDPAAAKEVRVCRVERDLMARHASARAAVARERDRAEWTGAAFVAAGWALFAGAFVAAIAIVADRAAAGNATTGDVVLVVTLTSQVNGNVAAVVRGVSWLDQALRAAGHFRWLLDLAATTPANHQTVPVPARIRDGVAIEGVSFRYPDTEGLVLDRVELRVPAGTTVALVGENGAGKTTLVKLLCRFYAPTAGRITVDGADIASLDRDEWRSATSAAFQDFCRFELIAAEAVGIGDLSALDDRHAVRRALDQVGAAGLEDQLPDGLDTQLGTTWGGVDLSVGQWQKVALARATRRPFPLLLVLDEPTASLDAHSEALLFEQFHRLSTETGGRGGVTVIVSHRFSTVRMADLIAVLQGGRIVEQGTHDDLMALGGTYAELYEIQAASYRSPAS